MSTVDAALAAMDTAEQEAHDHLDGDDPQDVEYGEWASDRLRLIQRDKATLQRHSASLWDEYWSDEDGTHEGPCCLGCRPTWDDATEWPCPDARAVIDHWENA